MKKMILGAIVLLLAGCRSASVPQEPLPLTLQAPHAQEMIVPPPLELGKLDLPEEPLPSAVISVACFAAIVAGGLFRVVADGAHLNLDY